MTFGSGEKAALAGGALLAAGLVTAVLLYLWPKQPAKEEQRPRKVEATTSRPKTPPAERPADAPAKPLRGSDLRREIKRLRDEVKRKDEEIAELRDLLREAGVNPDGGAPDEEMLAEETIRLLAECNRETPLRDIVTYRNRLVKYGVPAIPAVLRSLKSKKDVVYSKTWIIQDRRFTSYPTLRTLLIDSLYRMGVEGQSALVQVLGTIEDPLEICQVLGLLAEVTDDPEVSEARLEAARRYVDLPPPARETYVVEAVIDTLLDQDAEAAAASLEGLVRREGRREEVVRLALSRFHGLPREVATRTLADLALDAELGERGVMAAVQLAETPGPGTSRALGPLLEKAPSQLRRAVYRSIGDPVDKGLDEVEKTARRTNYGLAARSGLERVEEDLAGRVALLEARRELEEETSTRLALTEAEKGLSRLARRVAAIREKIEGE
jgi:hypothetical protein